MDSGDYDRGRNEEASAYLFPIAFAGIFPSEHTNAIVRVLLHLFVDFSTLLPSVGAFVTVLFLYLASLTDCQYAAFLLFLYYALITHIIINEV